PVMCSLFLKRADEQQPGRFNRGAERVFDAALNFYDRGLRFVFRHQLPVLVSTLLLMVVTGILYVKIPKGFFPQQDTGFVFGQAETRQDASFAMTAGLVRRI